MNRGVLRSVAVAVGVAAFGASCSYETGEVLRVGHANIAGWAIYNGSADAGADIADAVIREKLEVVGLSEACESQVAAAVDALGADRFEYVFQQTAGPDSPLPWSPPADSGCRYGNALMVRSDLDLEDVEAIELPTADRVEGTEFDPEEDRWALCGRVFAGRSIVVCATHLSNIEHSDGSRLRQASELHERVSAIAGADEAIVVVGDLNARRGHRDLAAFDDWEDASRSRGVLHVLVRDIQAAGRGRTSVGRADHDLLWAGVRLPDS